MIMDWRHALLLATSTGVSDNAGFNPMLLSRKPKSRSRVHETWSYNRSKNKNHAILHFRLSNKMR